MRPRTLIIALIVGCVVLLGVALRMKAQDTEERRFAQTEVALSKPGFRPFNERLWRGLQAPAGFEVNIFAQPSGNARMMAVSDDGTVYLTRQTQGDVVLLRDGNGDGQADEQLVVASKLELVHGITIHNNRVYLVAPKNVWVADINEDGTLTAPQLIITDLPDGGQHRARQIRVGPDQKLYIGVGSTCNDCNETNIENATILRANLDGTDRVIFAKGLRHTVGFGWQPQTGELWGMDMGSDWRGDDRPPEELNRIVEGANYGWPYCYDNKLVDEFTNSAPMNTTRAAYCAGTEAPVLTYTAHSAPIGMTFYDAAKFPADYKGDAFVALRGSWNRREPAGYKVVRINYENGQPIAIEDFLTGFLLNGQEQFARLAGVAVAQDGALLVSDDTNGVIYRVAYTGEAAE